MCKKWTDLNSRWSREGYSNPWEGARTLLRHVAFFLVQISFQSFSIFVHFSFVRVFSVRHRSVLISDWWYEDFLLDTSEPSLGANFGWVFGIPFAIIIVHFVTILVLDAAVKKAKHIFHIWPVFTYQKSQMFLRHAWIGSRHGRN